VVKGRAAAAFLLAFGATGCIPGTGSAGSSLPAGKYNCYLVPSYRYNGWVQVDAGNKYQAGVASGNPQTSGSYEFTPADSKVKWKGGSYQDQWPVAYYVAPNKYPDGKERTGTGHDRETIALKVDQGNPLLPGQETASNPIYTYCYLE
jgi:hypothetical protein